MELLLMVPKYMLYSMVILNTEAQESRLENTLCYDAVSSVIMLENYLNGIGNRWPAVSLLI